MNKKDIADIRKEFKLSSYLMPVKEIYSVYLKKDNGEIITKEFNYFEMIDIEKKELYLENFKNILTGAIDTKIFELEFAMNTDTKLDANKIESQNSTQKILYNALNSGASMIEYADKIVDKISENYTYETDIVINFVKVEYYKSNTKRNKEAVDDYVQAIELILCSINKIDLPKKALKFDYSEMKFRPTSALDITINLSSPLDGFMFPSFSSEYIDVNKIIYYSSKSKKMNSIFVEKVLGCAIKPTAIEEKESFNIILNTVVGDKIKPETMQEIYEQINEKIEECEGIEEEATVDIKEIQKVLENSGIENTEVVKSAFEQVCGGDYDFKIKNILPDFTSKSIKIENENASISITPNELEKIKVINENKKKYLVIEITEDLEVNGFKLEVENI